MRRVTLPPDFTWQRGFVSGPATTRWLHCSGKAVAVVAFHNDLWRTSVNRHLDIKRERSAAALSETMAVAWVERWAVSNAERIRRETGVENRSAIVETHR